MKPTQEQLAYKAQEKALKDIKFHGWMMGLVSDDNGTANPNPLTRSEIIAISASDKPYASHYRAYANKLEKGE